MPTKEKKVTVTKPADSKAPTTRQASRQAGDKDQKKDATKERKDK